MQSTPKVLDIYHRVDPRINARFIDKLQQMLSWQRQRILGEVLNSPVIHDVLNELGVSYLHLIAMSSLYGFPIELQRRIDSLVNRKQLLSELEQYIKSIPIATQEFPLNNLFGSMKNSVGNPEKGYVRNPVQADDNCGYTAFGIQCNEAYQLLCNNIMVVRDLLQLAIKEVLLTDEFYHYIIEREVISSSTTFEEIQNNIEAYTADLAVINGYIDYEVLDKRVDAGWPHPAIITSISKHTGDSVVYLAVGW